MQNRRLGKDLLVSAIGLGCMGMSHAYGRPSTLQEARNIIAQALDCGYTFFDTAESYGNELDPHHNENLLGELLRPYRDKVVIATKFGIHFDKTSTAVNKPLVVDSRPETIRKSVEGSLRRLKTDHIDLYYQHRYDPQRPIEETAGVMQQLIDEGKITHWGMSEAGAEIVERAHAVCPVTAIQNRYSMMARHYEALFPTLERLGVGFVSFSPLANGFLSGQYRGTEAFDKVSDYRSVMPQFTREAYEQNQTLLKLLEDLASEKGASKAQISLAWMLAKKDWILPIPGSRNLASLKENAQAADVTLTASEAAAIDAALNAIPMSAVYGGVVTKEKED